MASLEARLAGVPATPAPSTPGDPTPGPGSWQGILESFPPQDQCRYLLEEFYRFDVMFRTTHVPSFRRKAQDVLSRLPNLDFSHASIVARVLVALMMGATHAKERDRVLISHLDALYERAMSLIHRSLSSNSSLVNLDYVMTHITRSYRYIEGEDASPHASWLALGSAVHAARLFGLDTDPDEVDPDMSRLEKELRRRAWFLCVMSERCVESRGAAGHSPRMTHSRLLSEQLCMRPILWNHPATTRVPAIISDAALDDPSQPDNGIAEWSYVLVKRGMIQDRAQVDVRSAWSIDLVDSIITNLERERAALPPQYRLDRPIQADDPPWLFAQACIAQIGMDNRVLHQIRPSLLTTGDPAIHAFALERVVVLASRLIDTTQAFVTHVLFRWLEERTLNTWTFGTKVFNAGLALSYALLTNSMPEQRQELLVRLDSAIGAFCVMASDKGAPCEMNNKALSVLKRVRASIDAEAASSSESGDVVDPYTGREVLLRPFQRNYHTPTSLQDEVPMPPAFDYTELLDWDAWKEMLELGGA